MKSMYVDTLFRPAFEARSATAWALAVVWVVGLALTTGMVSPALMIMISLAMAMLLFRGLQTRAVWTNKIRLAGTQLAFVSTRQIREKQGQLAGKIWLGWGWTWQPSHTQKAYEIGNRDKAEIYPPKWFLKHFAGGLDPYTSKGKAWIHGMDDEKSIVLSRDTFGVGGTAIVATTGSIKTSLYKVLLFELALAGDCVIIIDPKGDKDLMSACRDAAAALGEPDRFICFRPSTPSSSVRIDGLKNWDRETQVASRIKQIISSEDNNFINFCWTVTASLTACLSIAGRRATIANLLELVESLEAPEKLCEEVLESYVPQHVENFSDKLNDAMRELDAQRGPTGKGKSKGGLAERAGPRLLALIRLFRELPEEKRLRPISGVIAMLDANREWFGKMVVAMVPMLTKLASLGPLLSPDYDDVQDTRPIYDMKKIVDGKKILYVGTDALSDASVASAIAALITADAAGYCGETYNYADGKPPVVHLLMDEAGDGLSEPMVNLLNKGRGAGVRVYLAFQTIADVITAMGNNSAMAERVLGNLNNYIIGATQDARTLQFLEDRLGEVAVKVKSQSQGSGQKTEDLGLEYSASRSVSVSERMQVLVPRNLLMSLPDLHYFAVLNRSEVVKGRIPILTFE